MIWPWSALGLEGPCGLAEVKRAYAQRVKTAHPEDDPEGFQQLHAAYLAARKLASAAVMEIDMETAPPELVQEENAPREREPPPKQETETWDYEKLFAEGDEERVLAQRRKAEDRLQKAQTRRRAQKKARRDRALEDEEARNAACAALHALEELWSIGAPAEEWVLFLHGSTFLNAQHNLDFIFGLEDFLTEHPQLPDAVRRHMFLTYRFYNGRPEAIYSGLYRLLKSGGKKSENGEKVKIPWRKRVFRRERAFLFLAWFLALLIFADHFFLSGAASPKGPEPGSISTEGQTAADKISDEERQGMEDVRDLAIALAARDYPGPYAVSAVGLSESRDDARETFYWAQCTGKTGNGEELVMNYFLSLDGARVFCVPEEKNTGVISVEAAGSTAINGKTVEIYRCGE